MSAAARTWSWARAATLVACVSCQVTLGCTNPDADKPETSPRIAYTEARAPCADYRPERRPLFGDLHVHTTLSFDAHAYKTAVTPEEAWRFAQGDPVALAPLGSDGKGTRTVTIGTPLDFAALTDHGDLLGEVALCTEPESPAYNLPRCVKYRDPKQTGAFDMALALSSFSPVRYPDLCGDDGALCRTWAKKRWQRVQAAAEAAYDRTAACTFTAFVAYEYTNTRGVSNLHRNVVFRNDKVTELPVSHFEAPTEWKLWEQLDSQCNQGDAGCDVLTLGHNSNLSNGHYFSQKWREGLSLDAQVARAKLRARMEPAVEMFQHKGDMECRNGLKGGAPTADPLCDFEKLRPTDTELCDEDAPGSGGMRLWGCLHRLDFVREALKEGLSLRADLGVNPYRFGIIGSTDTHNGTPGHTQSAGFPGHVGLVDDTPDKRLGSGTATHDGIINNPGGLAGVWAEENSRDAIFAAIRRRETFATSGPRLPVRLIAAWDLPAGLCGDAERDAKALGVGVPMGGSLAVDDAKGRAPALLVHATAAVDGGAKLHKLQVVKLWLDAAGAAHETVMDVAGATDKAPGPDLATCAVPTGGAASLCAVWRDPSYAAGQRAVYYARAVQRPTCRWSRQVCNGLPAAKRPEACDSGAVPDTVQHRAWTASVWVE